MTWMLIVWMCTGPGRAGECRPVPDVAYPSRAACFHAKRAALAAQPTIIAHCRLHHDANPIRDGGALGVNPEGEAP